MTQAMIHLLDLKPQKTHYILDITAEPLVRERLLELGLAPGRKIQVLRALPFSGPIVVQSGSVVIALRREEAEHVWVEAVTC